MLSGNGYNTGFRIDGYVPMPDEEMRASVITVGAKFFETLRTPLLRGREFTPSEEPMPEAAPVESSTSTRPPPPPARARVAILGAAMATKYFGDANPIGKYITLGLRIGVRYEIVGVARDTKYQRNLRAKTPLELYIPYFGSPVMMPPTMFLRTRARFSLLAPEIRRVVAEAEPGVSVASLSTMDEVVDRLLVRERLLTQLVGFFSVFAIALASLGLYGLLSYGVARRTREIGVRVALGATIGDVARLVVRQGVVLATVGCAIGIAGALLAARLVASLLYGVTPADPVSYVAVGAILSCVAALACWLPARRATRVDPIIALRSD
jgi:putative ABC transport system permease protein